MKKVSIMAVIAVLAALTVAAQQTMAKEKGGKQASTGEARWHGTITRSDKDGHTLTVRRRGQQIEKIIHYTDETKWTQGTKPIDMNEIKDGDEVICLGKYDEKGDFVATRIDLRRR